MRKNFLLWDLVVQITGMREGQYLVNAVAEKGKAMTYIRRKDRKKRPGTGDVFSSVVAGVCVRGGSLTEGVALAADFVKDCIRRSEELRSLLKMESVLKN